MKIRQIGPNWMLFRQIILEIYLSDTWLIGPHGMLLAPN